MVVALALPCVARGLLLGVLIRVFLSTFPSLSDHVGRRVAGQAPDTSSLVSAVPPRLVVKKKEPRREVGPGGLRSSLCIPCRALRGLAGQ